MSVERVAVSLEPGLLARVEGSMGRRAHWNRSKAISSMLRDWLSQEEWAGGKGRRVGTISFVYDHHAHGALGRITEIQHDSGASIISAMHVHLSHEECLEILAVKCGAGAMQRIADRIASVRGVKSCKLSVVK